MKIDTFIDCYFYVAVNELSISADTDTLELTLKIRITWSEAFQTFLRTVANIKNNLFILNEALKKYNSKSNEIANRQKQC